MKWLGIATCTSCLACAPARVGSHARGVTGNLSSVFAQAAGGDTILLAAGDYGTFSGGSKPATVTLRPHPGATATMDVNFNPAASCGSRASRSATSTSRARPTTWPSPAARITARR